MVRISTALFVLVLLGGAGAPASPDEVSAVVRVGPKDATACGDLLLQLKRKPPRLDFRGCRVDREYGLKALAADYRVEGRYAGLVERYFVEMANMPALRFVCCGWDSIATAHRDGWLRDGPVAYQISMTSGETLFNRREDWRRIPWFEVRVIRYLEEP